MTRGTPRLSLTGSPLIRLLARLAEVDAPDSKQAFAERLSHWLSWTDAISLSAALKSSESSARPAPRPGGAAASASPTDPKSATGPGAQDASRQRAALEKTLAFEPTEARPRSSRPGHRPEPAPEAAVDFPSHRRHYFARQQAMDMTVTALRSHLRSLLAQRSPEMARLAAVDAVMEQALGERERSLLSAVPVLLERRFEQLRRAALVEAETAESSDLASSPTPSIVSDAALPGAWLTTFRQDMHSVLLAELDLRWQPIDGLLEALRAQPLP